MGRVPFENFLHVLFGVPSSGDVIKSLVILGHGALLVLDEAVLSGKSHRLGGQLPLLLSHAIYRISDAWQVIRTQTCSPCHSCMPRIDEQVRVCRLTSTRRAAIEALEGVPPS